jgi:hypothetical protein
MANHLIASERAAKRQRQIVWLRERGLLDQLPNAETPPTEAQRELLRTVVEDMTHAGLYSRSSEPRSLRWGVRRLVSEARGEPVRFTTRGLS